MKLSEMEEGTLRQLESVLGNLLIDEKDMKMSELQDKILEMLEEA